jgi:hypothetical protein
MCFMMRATLCDEYLILVRRQGGGGTMQVVIRVGFGHGHFSQLLSAAIAAAVTLQQQQEESIIFNGMELVQKPIAQPQPEMPIFLSILKGQSFFQTSSSTHVHLFLPRFKCSNANL